MNDPSIEVFRCRVYTTPEAAPVTHLQCAHCHKISDDAEPGMSREAVTALRRRMEERGWYTATPADDHPVTWRQAEDFCSRACARREGESALEREIREARALRCDAHRDGMTFADIGCADCHAKRRAA